MASKKAGQSGTAWVPKPMQAKLLEAARSQEVELTFVAMCREAGVPRTTFYRWLEKDHGFATAWANLWRSSGDMYAPLVDQANIRAALGGDVQAQRLWYQRRGELKEHHELSGPGGASLFDEAAFMSKLNRLVEESKPKPEPEAK